MKHAGDVLDVDASCGNIGRDEHTGRSGVEGLQSTIALGLGTAPVQRDGMDTRAGELAREPIGPVPGSAEHDRALVAGDNVRRERDPVVAIDFPEQMANLAGGGLCQLDLMTHRVRLVAADQYVHLAVECRREQEDLAVAGSLVENAPHCREESHVRHAICLIDDGDGHVLKTYVAPVDEVLETAWASHQDVDGLTQGPQLRSVARAAIDGGDGEASRSSRGD